MRPPAKSPSLGAVSLTVAVPQGNASEAEANQVGKEKTTSSCGFLSGRPHTTLHGDASASNDPQSTKRHPFFEARADLLRDPTRRRLNLHAPIRRPACSG